MLLALTVVSVFANFTSVSGVVHDSKTNTAWEHGGSVKVFDCSDAGQVALGSGVAMIAVDGTFSITGLANPGAFRPLCVEFVYAAGPGGTPPSVIEFIADQSSDSGDHNMGTIHTDTGPTAVTLQNATADSNTTTAVGIGFVVLMLAGVTFVTTRRREVA